MSQPTIFDSEVPLPDEGLIRREKTLLGFTDRYARVHDQLRLLLNVGALTDAFRKVTVAAGKSRRAILIIDEGDSLATAEAVDVTDFAK